MAKRHWRLVRLALSPVAAATVAIGLYILIDPLGFIDMCIALAKRIGVLFPVLWSAFAILEFLFLVALAMEEAEEAEDAAQLEE